MTNTEELSLKKVVQGQVVKWAVGALLTAAVGLTAFYYTTKAEIQYQRSEISELKEAVKEASPEEIGRIKNDLKELQEKVEKISVQVESSTRIMESFKNDQERKVDKMLELLIEIRRQ